MQRRNRKLSPSDVVIVGKTPMDRLWNDLAPFELPDAPPAASGWITVQELAARLRIAKQTSHVRLQRLLRDGKVERIKARGRNGAPPTYFYRPVRS